MAANPAYCIGKPSYENLVSGMVLNHSITPIGQRFYKDFTAHWNAPQSQDPFTVVVVERFNPQWGSLIWVTIDNIVVFQRFLSARGGDGEDLAKQAVVDAQQYILRRAIMRQYLKSDDLKGDGY